MILGAAIAHLVTSHDVSVRSDFDRMESEVAAALGGDEPFVAEALGMFALGAFEAALVRPGEVLAHREFDVSDDDYAWALRFVVCAPPRICRGRMIEGATSRDVIPFQGDHLKVFGENFDEGEWRALGSPRGATFAADNVRRAYRAGEEEGISAYGEALAGPAIELRAGLWMLRAHVLTSMESGTPVDAETAVSLVSDYVREVYV